jgi:hypothetical protein
VVVLRTPGTVVARDVILATDVTNIVGCILGTAGYGQLVALTDKSDATNYANTFGNADTTNGRAVKIQYGASTALATFAKAAISLELPATIKHADPADPAATYTSIGARASDGRPVYRISGGSALALANTGEIVSATVLSTTGDILYASAANTPARLGIGTARQVLATNAAATAPEWVASLQSLMTASGDIVYASGANTPARLAKGSDGDVLKLASGLPSWSATTTSLTSAEGDVAGDVALNNTANYFDGPSVSLTAGTWLLVGAVAVQDTAGIANIAAKLWNGTTVESSGQVTISAINYGAMIPLAGIVTAAGAETWKISARDVTSTSGKILATTTLVGTSGNNASFLRAVKIA